MAKFKVGDKVVIKDTNYYHRHLKNYCKIDEVLTINLVESKKGSYDFIEVNNNSFGAYETRFKLANSQIIKKRLGIV